MNKTNETKDMKDMEEEKTQEEKEKQEKIQKRIVSSKIGCHMTFLKCILCCFYK